MSIKKGANKRSRTNTLTDLHLILTRTDINLLPSRLEYYHDQYIQQLIATRTDINLCPSGYRPRAIAM